MIRWWLVLTSLVTRRRDEQAVARRLRMYVGPQRPLRRFVPVR